MMEPLAINYEREGRREGDKRERERDKTSRGGQGTEQPMIDLDYTGL